MSKKVETHHGKATERGFAASSSDSKKYADGWDRIFKKRKILSEIDQWEIDNQDELDELWEEWAREHGVGVDSLKLDYWDWLDEKFEERVILCKECGKPCSKKKYHGSYIHPKCWDEARADMLRAEYKDARACGEA